MTLPRLGATLALAVVSSAALVVPSATAGAGARQAEVTVIGVGAGVQYPLLVGLNDEPTGISVGVSTTGTTKVTVTAGGPGLDVANPTQSSTTVEDRGRWGAGFLFLVTATTPGMHALTVTVTPDGGAPQSVTAPYVISRGSMAITGTASLAGRTYGYESVEGAGAAPSRYVKMLSFVDEHYALVGLPPEGRPTCTRRSADCLPYAYDEASGLLQVGGEIVGKVLGQGLYTDGWVRQSTASTGGQYFATEPLTYAPRGRRLAGTWRYHNQHYHEGIWSERLVLRKDGTYRLVYTATTGSGPSPTRSTKRSLGTYRITQPGRIVFRRHGSVFSVGTLALVGDKLHKPRANKLGLWLLLSGKHGRATDGNLLAPVKR